MTEFEPFPKLARLSRDMIVTEKIDGTNAQIIIDEDGTVAAGSRTRIITPGKTTDNFGFAGWVEDNKEALRALGPGRHFGEWWGQGIQRRYGLNEKRFSLFNTDRWKSAANLGLIDSPEVPPSTRCLAVPCCHVVPVLLQYTFDTTRVDVVLSDLELFGSRAAPFFMQPEGVVVFHVASRQLFKKTLDANDDHKGQIVMKGAA